jgi:hypothetical protein
MRFLNTISLNLNVINKTQQRERHTRLDRVSALIILKQIIRSHTKS